MPGGQDPNDINTYDFVTYEDFASFPATGSDDTVYHAENDGDWDDPGTDLWFWDINAGTPQYEKFVGPRPKKPPRTGGS